MGAATAAGRALEGAHRPVSDSAEEEWKLLPRRGGGQAGHPAKPPEPRPVEWKE